MLDCAAGHKIARKMSDGMTTLAKGTNRIPIPDSELQGEERYLVYFRIQIKGYAESAINDTITVLGEEPDTLVLPAGLLRIEDYAFEGGAFQAVIIPDGCTEIGAGAFANCSNLIYVSYPEGMAIGDGAFAGCGTGIVLDER